MRCPNCKTENPAGKKFCGDCGAPLKNRCPKCGSDNPDGKRFCGECGAPLSVSEAQGVTSASSLANKPHESRIRITDATVPESVEGERKTVTALFADIKGSTELEQDLDPEEARAIVDPALMLMIEAVRRYDGYIVQSTGDGVFALFGAPVAHEDHPQRALYAALRMQEELRRYGGKLQEEGRAPIEIRVGVNTGEVVVRAIATGANQVEYTPIGHTTNLASRIQSIARTGSVVVSDATRKLVEGYFALKSLGAARVKGVSEPVNVYEVTGLGPLRTRLQRSAGRGLTRFVGREREMETMRNAAALARAGRGQVVAAMAEAGTGKSRLFFEFKATNQSGWMVLEAFSVSHGKASAYLPVIDLLHSYFDIKSEDDARKRREKVNGRIVTLDPALEDTRPYMFALLGIADGDDTLAQMDAQSKSRRTLDAIKRILLRESLNQPLMVIFEDLHWIDEHTQELLNLLADAIANARILLLVNYRPQYSHHWNSKTYYTQLRLDPLGQESADEMLSALLGDASELAPLKRLITGKTEGNPFFMEEMVQVLLDEGALMRNGVVKLTKPIAELKIPPTVQGILAARIDRLAAGAKDLLQTLAVIGREFPISLVRAVVVNSNDEIERRLNDLQLGEFIYEQPAVGDTEYVFKHALTQEVAYNSVLMERRKALHERIGGALEVQYANSLEDHLAELAHHYTRSANNDKAVTFLALAGRQAFGRYAYAESRTQFSEGLQLIAKLPESPQRDIRESELASALAGACWRLEGVDAPETAEAVLRASSLAEKTGNLAELINELFLQRVIISRAGDFSGASALANRILQLAEREGSAASFAYAYNSTVQARLNEGDLAGVETQFALWRNYQDATSTGGVFRERTTVVLATAADCAWAMGRIDLARERMAEATAYVAALKEPFPLMIAKWFEGRLYFLIREPEQALAAASQSIALSEDNGIRLEPENIATKAWALAHLANPAEGLALLDGQLHDRAVRLRGSYLVIHAEVQAMAGIYDAAMESVESVLSIQQQNFYRPEHLRVRGEIRIKLMQPEAAEADFREAIALAQKMSAKSWELRTTTSLARLLRDTDRRDEARAMLAEIYNGFTEGFDTADLKDAGALLGELSN